MEDGFGMTDSVAERVVFDGLGGIHLVSDVRGSPDAWTVLFLHGVGQTRHAWGRTAQIVASQGWRTIALDLRGHGDSDWSPNGDYSFAAFAGDTIAVAKQLEKPPIIVGASLGGRAAILAEESSDRKLSSGLVIVDMTYMSNPAGSQRIKTFMRSGLDGFDTLDEAAEVIAAYTPNRSRQINVEGLHKVLRNRKGRWHWHWDPAVVSIDRNQAELERQENLGDYSAKTIELPMLLIWGLMSDVVTQEGVDDLLARFPNGTVATVDGAAHMIAGDRNDAFSKAINTFLEEKIRPILKASEAT